MSCTATTSWAYCNEAWEKSHSTVRRVGRIDRNNEKYPHSNVAVGMDLLGDSFVENRVVVAKGFLAIDFHCFSDFQAVFGKALE